MLNDKDHTRVITCTTFNSDKITFDLETGHFYAYGGTSRDGIPGVGVCISHDDAMALSHDLQVYANFDEITLLDDKCEALERYVKHLQKTLVTANGLIDDSVSRVESLKSELSDTYKVVNQCSDTIEKMTQDAEERSDELEILMGLSGDS